MEQGAAIAAYHLSEARRVYGSPVESSPAYQDAKKLLDWMGSKKLERISKSKIMNSGPNSLRKKSAIESCLKILNEHGTARVVKNKDGVQEVEINPGYLRGVKNE